MIEFDEKYFQGEIRDGYYVESDKKRLWAANLEVLMEIDRICKKHHIAYFLAYGTLLGAVRHNGFIPWDDDLDIIMLRREYMKFLSVVEKELTYPLVSLDPYHDETWDMPFARIVNGKYGINTEPWYLERFHGYPYSAGVDVFMFDNQWNREDDYYYVAKQIGRLDCLVDLLKERKKMQEGEKESENSAGKEEERKEIEEKIESMLEEAERDYGIPIDREKDIRNQLLRIENGFFALCEDENSEEIIVWPVIGSREFYAAGYKREWYRESIELPFEGIMLPVPVGFHESLMRTYGVDYLSPVKHSHNLDKRNDKIIREMKSEAGNFKGKLDNLEKLLEGGEKS